MLVDPGLGATAAYQVVGLAEARRVFIGGDQVGRVARQAAVADQAGVAGNRAQGFAQHDAALDVVDFVVLLRCKVASLQHDASVLVAYLDPDTLGALGDVLATQVVQRATGAAVFVASGQGARVGRKQLDAAAAFAILRLSRVSPVQLGAVQATVVLHQLGAADAGMEVTPHHVRAAALEAHIELALGRRVFHRGAVIAVDRVVKIRVQTAQQRARVLVHKVRKQIVERLLAGIGGSGQQVFALDLAFQVEGKAAIHVHLVIEMLGVVVGDQLCRAARAVGADRQVAKGDVEPVFVGNADVALELGDSAVRLDQLHAHLVGADRQDLARGEAAMRIHRHPAAHHRYALLGPDVVAVDRHCATLHRDVADQAAVLAVHRELRGLRIFGQLHGGECQVSWTGFVEATVGIVDTQHEAQAVIELAQHLPGERCAGRDRQYQVGCLLKAATVAEQADLRALDPRRVVGVAGEQHLALAVDGQRHGANVQPRCLFQAVVADLYLGFRCRKVGATLAADTVCRALLAERHTIDTDLEGQISGRLCRALALYGLVAIDCALGVPARRSGSKHGAVIGNIAGGAGYGADRGRRIRVAVLRLGHRRNVQAGHGAEQAKSLHRFHCSAPPALISVSMCSG